MAKEKILVVDDSATQLIMYKMALTKVGYRVISAKNGVEGMNLVETENPDLIVSDIIMPELNGYQFCRLVKDDPSRAHIPIILLTSLGQQQDRFWGIEAGANSFVTKSTDTSVLITEVERLLKDAARPQKAVYETKEEERYELTETAEGEESVKSKINRILERLLYESTVSNRMRDLSRFAYSRTEMFRKFYELFEQIVEYHLAVVSLYSHDQIHLILDLQKEITPDFIEKSCQAVLDDDANPERVRLGVVRNQRRETFHEEFIREEGQKAFNSSMIVPLNDNGEIIGMVAVFTSDTFAYNKDIYKLMQLIARELVLTIRYISKLEEIERIKNNFTSTIVNDLRAPIMANQSFVEALYNEYVDSVTEDQKEILGNILMNNRRLLSFINDILDVSKLDSGSLEIFPELNPVKPAVDEAIRNIQILAQQKELVLINEMEDETLSAGFDHEKIVQVLNNLISNSIKYTPNGGEIYVNAYADPEIEDAVQFYVRDTGVGIPEEEIPLIFDKYKRTGGVFSSDEGESGGGVGLGLAICKAIVEAHQGKIWVKSALGEGTTFFFTIRNMT